MSRCFPFPPPGYEKKARTDDVDLLTKEKHKDKKHKKEKDKRREGEEKKDKEKSKDKRKEKKDRKEKRKDKKKDNDRDKDKNKNSDEKKIDGQLEGYNAGRPGENCQQARENKDSKFVEEFGRRLGYEESGTRNQMVGNFTGINQRIDGTGRMVVKDFDNKGEGKENIKDKKGHDRKSDGQGNRYEEKGLGNSFVQNFIGMDQRTAGGMAKPMDKDAEKRMEGKEKNKDEEGENKQGNRYKERDGEKKNKAKDKNKDKKKEKEEKGNTKNKKQDKFKESGKNAHMDALSTGPLHIPRDSDKSASTEGNVRKRKDFEMNGFVRDSDLRPNKLPKLALVSHPFTENGRKLEPCQTAIQHASIRLGEDNNLKVSKGHKVNGIIEAQPSVVDSTRIYKTTTQPWQDQPSTARGVENGEASTKPPHPDSKYLSQILTVPKMEEWSDFDDQEWLFNSDSVQLKKPKLVSSRAEETPEVWDKAQRIESADVCALPYVIPY